MRIDLNNFFVEYNIHYRTLSLFEKIQGKDYGVDKGFIIVDEPMVNQVTNFLTENMVNPDKLSVIVGFSKLFPLEGNFKKMVAVLQENFKLDLLPNNQPIFFKSESQIKAEANKELYNTFLSGNLKDCENILEKYKSIGLTPDQSCLSAAIKSGNVEKVIFLKTNFQLEPKARDTSCFMYAIDVAKSLEMIQYLAKTYKFLNFEARARNDLSWAAARTGNLEILKFCVEKLFWMVDSGTLYDATRSKNIDLVKYLVEERKFSDIEESLNLAHTNNIHDIADYLESVKIQSPTI